MGAYLVDRDVDELDEETNESHHEESNTSGECHFMELCSVGLLAFCNEVCAVLVELPVKKIHNAVSGSIIAEFHKKSVRHLLERLDHALADDVAIGV